ncbi:MAG: T9SS type A sorting domain-containing protein [Mariniphaga sp.]|nr:T9SS type A sorting domain-containing protein [Mariniphaga sp.]
MKKIFTAIILLASLVVQAQTERYSWETQHAKVLPSGDLEWAPREFQLETGNSVRYIDFDNGDDFNNGLTPATAWKRHPWDHLAMGKPRNSTGIHTYIFKRGVIYRGRLVAKESGMPGNPVRLTSDPDWGTGEAAIYASASIEGGWKKADEEIAPNIPNPTMVWYQKIPKLENYTKMVCEVSDSVIKRVYVARSPNFVNTPEEPMKTWWSFTNKGTATGGLNLTDTRNLTQSEVDFYKGGDVWAIEDKIVMCTLWKQKITDYNPATRTITVSNTNFGGKDCKYYVENTPFMLDAPGEYYYDRVSGILFLRLEDDKDPNTTSIEVASRSNIITMNTKDHIEISGLTFGFTTYDNVRHGLTDGMPAIRIEGGSDIVIKNCKFQYLNGGIMFNGTGKNLVISDNEMIYMDDFSIFLNGPDEASVLRNKIVENGTRHLGQWYSSIPAIAGTLSVGELAGNIVEHTWGSGINFTWGKGGSSDANIPFIRGLVHHNRVSHSLQGVNDYGGIESWQGGPVFHYNNISEDAQGWHYNWGGIQSLGYAIYLDGSFKNYVFNNIVKGRGWNLNSAAYMHVLGFYNMYVHNVAYNVESLTFSGDGGLAPDGQNYYLANVSDSTKLQFNHTTRHSGIPFESYGNNFFSGNAFRGTFLTNQPNNRYNFTFSQFVDRLNSYNPDLGQVGFETSKRVFTQPHAGDFMPHESSELIDQGVKFFAPFPLSRVVGEWHFYKHNADTTLIKGENFYFTSEFNDRHTYNDFPKNHLKAYGLSTNSFVMGELEDWATGALKFDGIQTYCDLKDAATSLTVCNNVDMTTNGFILEGYVKTEEGHHNGSLISKYGSTGYGYQLDIDPSGYARFSMMNNGTRTFSQLSSTLLNDGNWHHFLVEVDRESNQVSIYIDGMAANGGATGTIASAAISLTNTSNLLIGKNADGNFFSGTMDFIRISKGTLSDAKTTIEELYKWQFDGPFLYDFAGNAPIGRRDAGALEKGGKLCDLTVSENPLKFGLKGGTKSFTIDAEMGYEITKKSVSFFTYSVSGNTITVTVPALTSGTRTGQIYIYGCNETREIQITQGPLTHTEIVPECEILVMPNPVSENQQLTISVPGSLKESRATIMDIRGKVIMQRPVYGGINKLDVRLQKGMYLIKISGEEMNYTTKIIVQE